jgi:two-component system NarL family sensor kinase
VHLEDRERRGLSERLHDGALQYVLAARLDLDDLRQGAGDEAVDRIEQALTESSRMLRSTVSELHPAVLERAGLARALRALAAATARRDLTVDVDVDGWPEGARTQIDALLFGAAREFLSNVVRHADANHVRVSLQSDGDHARLVVADDGRGMPEPAASQRLGEGHIGLHSQTLRIEAAGGTLAVVGGSSGTLATVVVPMIS